MTPQEIADTYRKRIETLEKQLKKDERIDELAVNRTAAIEHVATSILEVAKAIREKRA
jgi:hypothetical protein